MRKEITWRRTEQKETRSYDICESVLLAMPKARSSLEFLLKPVWASD